MLDLAETLDPLLNERMVRLENGEEDDEDVSETTLQLVFFDGEEAFKDWTATDSIYGARYVSPHHNFPCACSRTQTLGSQVVDDLHCPSYETKVTASVIDGAGNNRASNPT